jgi:LuxR family transcriptional regulator, maltose regulon positive regulatory protein
MGVGAEGALLTAFPASVAAADAELTALTAAAELARGSLEEAERQLALAIQRSASVPAAWRERLEVMLTVLRLYLGPAAWGPSGVV